MVSCVFPGSFDPVTIGHADLIERAADMFDHVTVAVMINPHKKCFISAEKRAELLRKLCGGYANVTVDLWDGLLVDYLRQKGESIILLLDANGISCSTGSACSSGSLGSSHVLDAIGVPVTKANGACRLTVGDMTTEEDIDYVVEKLKVIVERLRELSPVNGAEGW